MTSVASSQAVVGRATTFDRERVLLVSLIALFVLAGGARLNQIGSLYAGPLVDREYHSALIARGLYLEATASASDPRLEVAIVNKEREGVLEPRVIEYLAYAGYRIAGQENLVIPRLMSAAFWLIGGLLLFGIAKRVTSSAAAVVAVAYYLFIPEGLRISVGFQPDSLMMLLFLASVAAIVRYYDHPSTWGLLLAAALSGLTLLIRPLPVFMIFSIYVALGIWKWCSLRWLVSRQTLLFGAITLLPAAVYYLYYGVFVAEFMQWKSATSFMPSLFLRSEFWRGWFVVAMAILGPPAVLGALVGVSFLGKGLPRALLVGAAVGYLLFGLVFNFHIHTHGYYQAQLVPFIAIALGALAAVLFGHLRHVSNSWYWWAPVAAAVLVIAVMGILDVRSRTAQLRIERPEVAREVGDLVHHSTKVLILAPYYGSTLKYYGELSGEPWTRAITSNPVYRLPGERELSIQERLDRLSFSPEYFAITDFREYEAHHADMRKFLEENWQLIARTDGYIIYKAPVT